MYGGEAEWSAKAQECKSAKELALGVSVCARRFVVPANNVLAGDLGPADDRWRGFYAALHFFDVGQGDSSLVQCGRTQALIDGGPDRSVLQGLGRVMPFTDRRIEYVILSHPHSDHFFGLFAVLERYEVGRLIMTEYSLESEAGRQLADLAVDSGVEVLLAEAGDTMTLGDCGEFEVLWPDDRAEEIAGSGRDYDNDLSLVLELSADGRSLALFTGDINAEVEGALLADGSLRQTTILKVPHHGSRYSSTYNFIQKIRPEFAVIQVGQNNFGQPSKTVIHRLNKAGAQVQRTDLDGDLVFDLSSASH